MQFEWNGVGSLEKIDPPMESLDWESPSKPPETCDQSRKSKLLERWEEQVSKYRNSKNQQGQSRDIPEDILMAALGSLVPRFIYR